MKKRKTGQAASVTERVKKHNENLIGLGGAKKTWRLSPEANSALKNIMAMSEHQTETKAVEYSLLLAERMLNMSKQSD